MYREHGIRGGPAGATFGFVVAKALGKCVDAGLVDQGHVALGEVHVAQIAVVDGVLQVDEGVA